MAIAAGVYARERDESFGTPTIADSVGAIVITSDRGPTGVKLVTSRSLFLSLYGEPTSDTISKHCALQFLNDANQLNVVRVVNDATAASIIASDENSEPTFTIEAENPGEWGNNINVTFGRVQRDVELFVLNVLYDDELVESFEVSKNPDKISGFGRSQYIEDVINGRSEYIRIDDDASNSNPPDFDETLVLMGGSNDSSPVTSGDIINAWTENFTSVEDVDANILINAGWADSTVQNAMIGVAESRGNAVAVLDIPEEDSNDVQRMIDYVDGGNFDTSWAAIYGSWLQIYDEFADRNILIPPSGNVAGVYARTSEIAESWTAPAGTRRGTLNVLGVQKNFEQGELDLLDQNRINPIVSFSGGGVVVWGQQTLQADPSSLSEVAVRRLLIHIQNTLKLSLRPFVFQPNTEFTRASINTLITNFLSDIEAREGVYYFSVDTSTEINTPQVIDNGDLMVNIVIQPTRTAKRIFLTTTLAPTGVTFG